MITSISLIIILIVFFFFVCKLLLVIFDKICYNILRKITKYGNPTIQKFISKILGA